MGSPGTTRENDMTQTAIKPRKNALKTMNGFWWANLSTSDDAAAAEFYGRVLGWTFQEMPISDTMVHRNAVSGELQLAGIDPLMPGAEWPTAWTNYVYVEDLEATVAAARKLGATVAMEPMDVMGQGHMAIVVDPTGAAVGLWQPGLHTGADAVNQPSTYTWVELATSDLAGARSFYSDWLGWTWTRMDGEMEYWLAELDGRSFAGAYAKTDEMADAPSHWVPYFGVADIATAAADVKSAGGAVLVGPMQMGPGKGICATDPQGGYFCAIQMDEWPSD